MQPTPPDPQPSRSFIWPVAVNLGLLVLAALVWGPDSLPFVIGGLVVINALAASIMAFSKRLHFVPAFILSAVVVLLVGGGVCALMLRGVGGGH